MKRKVHRAFIEERVEDDGTWVIAVCSETHCREYADSTFRPVDEAIGKAVGYLNGRLGWPSECPNAEHVL